MGSKPVSPRKKAEQSLLLSDNAADGNSSLSPSTPDQDFSLDECSTPIKGESSTAICTTPKSRYCTYKGSLLPRRLFTASGGKNGPGSDEDLAEREPSMTGVAPLPVGGSNVAVRDKPLPIFDIRGISSPYDNLQGGMLLQQIQYIQLRKSAGNALVKPHELGEPAGPPSTILDALRRYMNQHYTLEKSNDNNTLEEAPGEDSEWNCTPPSSALVKLPKETRNAVNMFGDFNGNEQFALDKTEDMERTSTFDLIDMNECFIVNSFSNKTTNENTVPCPLNILCQRGIHVGPCDIADQKKLRQYTETPRLSYSDFLNKPPSCVFVSSTPRGPKAAMAPEAELLSAVGIIDISNADIHPNDGDSY